MRLANAKTCREDIVVDSHSTVLIIHVQDWTMIRQKQWYMFRLHQIWIWLVSSNVSAPPSRVSLPRTASLRRFKMCAAQNWGLVTREVLLQRFLHLLQQFDPCSFGTFQLSWLSFQDRLEPWDGPGPFQDPSSLGLNQAALWDVCNFCSLDPFAISVCTFRALVKATTPLCPSPHPNHYDGLCPTSAQRHFIKCFWNSVVLRSIS